MIPQSLYIHIPWCVRKCPYCDFNSHVLRPAADENVYIDHLLADLRHDADQRPLQSIFIGGGTPSLLSGKAVGRLLEGIHRLIPLSPTCEITLEANPGTFEQHKFSDYRAAGINRLSIGIQSFNPKHLQALGRIHDADEARRAVRIAEQAGFSRINLDIMFALPEQNISQALHDLKTALSFAPEHISWYQLTLEPNTAFYLHPPKLPDTDTQIDIFEAGSALLNQHGYRQYETSAWTSGAVCRHNLNYWQYGDYLGIGAGAHGKQTRQGRIIRTAKYRAPAAYQKAAGQHANPYTAERFTVAKNEQPFEIMMNALRLKDGIPTRLLSERTALNIDDIRPTLNTLVAQKLIAADIDRQLKTTTRGFALLNNVLTAFL